MSESRYAPSDLAALLAIGVWLALMLYVSLPSMWRAIRRQWAHRKEWF